MPSWHPQPCKARKRTKSARRAEGSRRAWERRGEDFDAVRFELAGDHAALIVFEARKHDLYRASLTSRATLVELTQEYMQSHTSEVAAALEHVADCDGYGREPCPTDEELDLESLASVLAETECAA